MRRIPGTALLVLALSAPEGISSFSPCAARWRPASAQPGTCRGASAASLVTRSACHPGRSLTQICMANGEGEEAGASRSRVSPLSFTDPTRRDPLDDDDDFYGDLMSASPTGKVSTSAPQTDAASSVLSAKKDGGGTAGAAAKGAAATGGRGGKAAGGKAGDESDAGGAAKGKKKGQYVPRLKRGSARDAAYSVLLQRESGGGAAFVETLLDTESARLGVTGPDRALCKELVLGCVRWRALLDHLVRLKTTGARKQLPGVTVLLRLGLYQVVLSSHVANFAAVDESVSLAKRCGLTPHAGFINAVLRAYAGAQEETAALLEELRASKPHVGWSHPEWLVKQWLKRLGPEATQELLAWNNRPPPVLARTNLLRTSAEALCARWTEEGVSYEPVEADWVLPGELHTIRVPTQIAALPSFADGGFYVQDASTLLSVRELAPQPGERVLDLCAAPGGKSVLMAQAMQNSGEIIASDIDPTRLERVAENCARLGVTCVRTVPADELDPLLEAGFDRILIDAPCSNTGVMRRRTDLRWRITQEEVRALHETQFGLLTRAAGMLRPGGALVYSTCSIEPDENRNVVNRFMKRNGEHFSLEFERQLSPETDATDGAFVARIVRKA